MYIVCMSAKSLQLCLTLCDPMDCIPPGSSVYGILQARIPECVTMPSSRDQTRVLRTPALAGRFFITGATQEAYVEDVSH